LFVQSWEKKLFSEKDFFTIFGPIFKSEISGAIGIDGSPIKLVGAEVVVITCIDTGRYILT